MPGTTHLRPFREEDLELLTRFATDPDFSAPFEWAGFRSPEVLRRRWVQDGLLDDEPRYLAVACGDGPADPAVGWVTWRDPVRFGRPGREWEIGAILAPEHRGRGVGTEAQAQLVRHLFDTTAVGRLSANTETDNLAEQRALEKCGFRCEGRLRDAGFRGGRWRDVLAYGCLRSDLGPA